MAERLPHELQNGRLARPRPARQHDALRFRVVFSAGAGPHVRSSIELEQVTYRIRSTRKPLSARLESPDGASSALSRNACTTIVGAWPRSDLAVAGAANLAVFRETGPDAC